MIDELHVENVALIHEAIRNGQKITIDQYPYTASMSSMSSPRAATSVATSTLTSPPR